ncbi:hypothetical protein Clacol_009125 [Clathrus columnatus]|uniref:Uncharacterized protein n=1 Tax=Clathrus columnatus TaxID=1419009 RepID=A0AAV5AM56_9AGAM|nr:hypothetical protein Clacol_009125 [Clathrus columnatus]
MGAPGRIRRASEIKWKSGSDRSEKSTLLRERSSSGDEQQHSKRPNKRHKPEGSSSSAHDHATCLNGDSPVRESSSFEYGIETDIDLTSSMVPAPGFNLKETVVPSSSSLPILPDTVLSPQLGRGHRIKKPEKRDDWLPEGPAPMLSLEQVGPANDPESNVVTLHVPSRQFLQLAPKARLIFVKKFWTSTNSFGISRLYYGEPSYIPDQHNTVANMTTKTLQSLPSQISNREICEAIWPYPNISSWRLGEWLWRSGDTKSLVGFKDLVNNVILAEDFTPAELHGVPWDKINSLLAARLPMSPEGEGWCEAHVEIQVPTGVKRKTSNKTPNSMRASKTFIVPGLWYRSICTIIKTVFSQDTVAETFHFNPFKQFWKTQSGTERVRDELFNSDMWLCTQEEIEALPRETDDMLPKCIAALMFSSNATHLAQFGQAKLWPVYLFFGNQSKWTRCQPSARASHHVIYLPTLPDSVIEFICGHVSSGAADALKTHCQHELFHAALNFLFDEDFLEAWNKGIVIDCIDGVKWRVFPRIFTWSADYPEKVLLASIRDLGMYPCPRCLVKKDDIPRLERQDKIEKARNSIYRDGFVVNSETVNQFLKDESLTPTELMFQNVFSRNLHVKNFDFFGMLVVDLMHEIELGCCMPAFQGLFGEQWDNKIQDLLFTSCCWHGIAKLRMHTEMTLELLDNLTSQLGNSLRFFENTICQHFDTFETPNEKAAQAQAQMWSAQKTGVYTNTQREIGPK